MNLEYQGSDVERQEEFNRAVEELVPYSRFTPNLTLLGEQTQLVDRIQAFKDTYSIEGACGITNLMRWSPGTAKSVKDRYDALKTNNGLKNKYKATTITRLLDNSYQRWHANNMYDEFKSIEDAVLSARANGFRLDTDDDMALELWEDFKSKLVAAGLQGYIRNHGIVKMIGNDGRYFPVRMDMPRIIFSFDLKSIDIRLLTGEDNCIGSIPFGDISIYFDIDLYWWLNAMLSCKANSKRFRMRDFDRNVRYGQSFTKILHYSFISPKYKGLHHPFVQRSGNSYTAGNTCFGNLQTSLYNTLMNLDIDLFSTLLHQWASNFHMRETGPLNGINQAIIGFDKSWPEDIATRMSVSWSTCERVYKLNYDGQPEKMVENHCNNCTLTARCDTYAEYLDVEMAKTRIDANKFWAELCNLFPFGVHTVNFSEDVLPFYDKRNITWEEDATLAEYEESLINREQDFYEYCWYKYKTPRNYEEAYERGISNSRVEEFMNDYHREYSLLDMQTRKAVIETYKSIFVTNERRSTDG